MNNIIFDDLVKEDEVARELAKEVEKAAKEVVENIVGGTGEDPKGTGILRKEKEEKVQDRVIPNRTERRRMIKRHRIKTKKAEARKTRNVKCDDCFYEAGTLCKNHSRKTKGNLCFSFKPKAKKEEIIE